jgi:uncharacterized protein
MRFEIYKDAAGQFRWRLVAANNEIIATGEAYRHRRDCLDAIELVRDSQHSPIQVKRKVK